MHTLFCEAAADNRVFRIAGDEQHMEIRPPLSRGVCELPPIYAAGEADVGDQQIDEGTGLKNL